MSPRGTPTRGDRGRFDGGRTDPDQDAADRRVSALIDAADTPDPLWKKRLRPVPAAQALALTPPNRTLNLHVSIRLAALASRAARDDGLTRAAWIRRTIAEEVSRRYGVPVAELDPTGSRE